MGDAELHTWLTVAALSRRLGRPPSTIRLWRDTYAAFVPQQINEDGHQTYPLERLAEIADMRARNLTPREIAAELERRHGGESREGGTVDEEREWRRQVLEELRAIRAALERLAEEP